jgi:hypothetical protein
MFMKLLFAGISLLITAVLFSLQAEDATQDSAAPQTPSIARVWCTGLASWESGQIYRGVFADNIFEHRWENRVFADLNLNSDVSDRLRVVAGLEGEMFFSQRNDNAFRQSLHKLSSIYLNQAEGIVTILDDKSAAPLALHGGYMLYKYDPQATNLGEYLFRSMTYPQVLFTQFDFTQARILGLRLNSKLWDKRIVSDLFITSAADFYPMYDFSIAYVGSIKPVDAVEIGYGADFDRVLSVDKTKTTPKTSDNTYVDPLNQADTTWYSFSGIKIMARLCFDPKAFFPHRILGQEDLKIFGEMAILGVRNYPGDYTNMWQRIPLMFGVNFPAFKLFDVIAVQGEYFRSPYANSYYTVMQRLVPRPEIEATRYGNNDWKWSVYASRKLFGGLSIIGQVANDHTEVDVAREEDAEYQETMRGNGMWCWMLKMKFEF